MTICRETPVASVIIRDRSTLGKLFLDPCLHFGDGYSNGRIEVKGDLVKLCRAIELLESPGETPRFQPKDWLRKHRNSLNGSKWNIRQHYDLGNDFYRLWLDRELVYTCAYFPRNGMSLEEAQTAKLEHICRKLQLKPGQTVIEAGCGWGALSLYMARRYGVKVSAYNISHEQIVYARDRAREEGLADKVEFIEKDWRHIAGNCDAFVSVGMLEHVGIENYRLLGEVINRCLNEKGVGLIHTIGRNAPAPLNRWTEERIFPGANPPSLREMMSIFEPREFSILDVENLRLHYAETLRHWLLRFEEHRDQVGKMFDERFIRMWRLYLSGSVASFQAGTLQLFQVVFCRARNNSIPWSRDYLYEENTPVPYAAIKEVDGYPHVVFKNEEDRP
ncbi:MAG: class I SAM-dependent methyltransferase [Planctomycetaceae bacterium]|nr:class I SAM-dependent methyltransferase [Planctomycetaceae bacterium]